MSANPHRIGAGLVAFVAAIVVLTSTRYAELALARVALPLALLVLALALAYAASAGPGAFRVGLAMLRRTTLTYRSYKVQVVSVFLWTGLTLLLYYVAAGPIFRILLGVRVESLPGQLVAILAVGLTTWSVFWKSWESTALGVRGEQWEGTLESNVPMPNGTRALPFGYLMSRLPFTILFQGLSIAAITFAIPGALRLDDPRAALDFMAVVVLSVVCMWGLGLLFGGLAILYKQVGPADLVVRTLFLFLAGVFVPTEVFPRWAQVVSNALPMTHTYRLLHFTAASGVPLVEAPTPLLVLMGWTVVAVVAGTVAYNAHVEKARRQGTIQGY